MIVLIWPRKAIIMTDAQEKTNNLEGLPPLPEGWQLIGGVPLNVAFHNRARAEGLYKPSTLESAQARIDQMRAGTYESESTPEEIAFMDAWMKRNRESGYRG